MSSGQAWKGRGEPHGAAKPVVEISDCLPGAAMVRQGLADLAAGETTEASLLILVGAPRLRQLGLVIPEPRITDPETALFARLSAEDPDAAHSRYNALIRLLVSFERSAESGGL